MYSIIRKDLLDWLRWSKAELCPSGSLVSLRECGELVATQAKMLKASEQEIDSADWESILEAKGMIAS